MHALLFVEKIVAITDENERSSKAKSAGNISERTTAQTIRSLSSVSLRANIESVERKQSENKAVSKASLMKETKTRDIGIKMKDGNYSKHNKVKDGAKQNESDNNVTTANSKILKPITLKLGKAHVAPLKEKSHITSKTQSHAHSQHNSHQQKTEVIHDDHDGKLKKGVRGVKLPDKVSRKVSECKLETAADTNAKMEEEDIYNEDETREGSGIDTKRRSKRFSKGTIITESLL